MAYLEQFAICIVVHVWSDDLRYLRCVLFCDNQSVVNMINQMTSSYKNCMKLIRMIMLLGLKINARVFAKYISSKNNFLADSLSRLQISKFKWASSHLAMEQHPSRILEAFWPISKVWVN